MALSGGNCAGAGAFSLWGVEKLSDGLCRRAAFGGPEWDGKWKHPGSRRRDGASLGMDLGEEMDQV